MGTETFGENPACGIAEAKGGSAGFSLAPENLMLWGFCGAAFFAPASISFSTVFALFSLSVWFVSGRFYKDRGLWKGQSWVWPVLLFMVIPWIGLLYSDDVAGGFREAKKSYYWLYAFAAATLACRGGRAKNIALSLLAGLSIMAVFYILQFVEIVPRYEAYKLGFINYITYSLFLVFGMLILSHYFAGGGRRGKVLTGLLMILFFVNLVIIPGRAGYLAFIAASPLIAYKMTGGKGALKAAAFALLITSAMFLSPLVRGRVTTALENVREYRAGNAATSVGMRLHMWQGAVRIFLERPLTGTGTGGYRLAMKEYEIPSVAGADIGQPHNSFLFMAASYGIAGLASIIWLFAVLLRRGWENRDSLRGFTFFCFTFIVAIGSLTGTQILQGQSAMLLAIFTGAGGLMKDTERGGQ